MSRKVVSVSQINEYIRCMLDSDIMLRSLAVKGEISNYKLYPSGHHYFTLKDDSSALKCVMFKQNALRMRFKLQNGMQVIAMGSVGVYPRDGVYQLNCTALLPDGIGDLHAAYEQLKNKLSSKGLFDPSHKKPIPKYPGTIGIVTSIAGAAIHDMLRILRKRFPLTKVLLLPVRVQGTEAPGEISAAIRYANQYKLADLLIVGRGGGSLEDLWSFNDEGVAQAIFDSQIPIISAVGHEPDVTISDFVADLRAATPSNAAELAVPDREALLQHIDSLSTAIQTMLLRQLKASQRHLDMLASSPAMQQPDGYILQRRSNLEMLQNRLIAAQNTNLARAYNRFVANTSKLDAMSPLKVLSRGYSLTTDNSGCVLKSVKQVRTDEQIQVRLNDGILHATVNDVKENQR